MLMSDSCDEWFQARVEGRRERERGRERGREGLLVLGWS
jgi:hypothetical protein